MTTRSSITNELIGALVTIVVLSAVVLGIVYL